MKRAILIGAVFITFMPCCRRTDESIERSYIDLFSKKRNQLEKILGYAEEKYFTISSLKHFNRIQFIIYPKEYINGSVISDSNVTKLMYDIPVHDISFEKGSSCPNNRLFDLVRFHLDPSASENQFYYVYSYCSLGSETVNNSRFKSISLGKGWYLEIEK